MPLFAGKQAPLLDVCVALNGVCIDTARLAYCSRQIHPLSVPGTHLDIYFLRRHRLRSAANIHFTQGFVGFAHCFITCARPPSASEEQARWRIKLLSNKIYLFLFHIAELLINLLPPRCATHTRAIKQFAHNQGLNECVFVCVCRINQSFCMLLCVCSVRPRALVTPPEANLRNKIVEQRR